MIKAVLFDLDGTLLNRDESLKSFILDQYSRLYDGLGHINKKQFTERFITLDNHGYVWKDKVYAQLIEEFDIQDYTVNFLLEDYMKHFKNHCIPFPNLIEMLRKLQNLGCSLGIISNGMTEFQLHNIRALGIESYFQTILISEKEGLRKPDPLIFQKALEQMKVSANECLFVGDHPENDVRASKKVGMTSVWKKDTYWDNIIADYTIEDLIEIINIVEVLRSYESIRVNS
ncbi:HAD family hydrolase [Sutcliffiella cohnii]|uniref:HAD family hydrolase n=1 Tax=Sutcliffiella cohnii TaxID=33932 RepID=UPI002E210127|nr:HAD family hydrolase [Sutcliffiella cohnii]